MTLEMTGKYYISGFDLIHNFATKILIQYNYDFALDIESSIIKRTFEPAHEIMVLIT